MKKAQININFQIMAKALKEHVRSKASRAGSTIVYRENNQLIEEDPRNSQKRIIKHSPHV